MTERGLALLDEVTERLRALLDERGVEWWETVVYIGTTITDEGIIERNYLVSTFWDSPVFGKVEATDMGDGVLHMACLNGRDFTPEQAVEVTLGPLTEQVTEQATNDTDAGTCHDTWERIIEDAREYRLNINGSYLWKNKSDKLVSRCKALAGDAE